MRPKILAAFVCMIALGCSHKPQHSDKHAGHHQCGGGCSHHHKQGHGEKMSCEMAMAQTALPTAAAQILPLGKSKVKGEVKFTTQGEALKVNVKLSGLKPNQKQGIHIHEFGNCSAKDGSSAGGHYNPTNGVHSSLEAADRHLGDLGNVLADGKGNAEMDIVSPNTQLKQIMGRAVVVHANEDDLKSQPAGEAGARVACGVIAVTQ